MLPRVDNSVCARVDLSYSVEKSGSVAGLPSFQDLRRGRLFFASGPLAG